MWFLLLGGAVAWVLYWESQTGFLSQALVPLEVEILGAVKSPVGNYDSLILSIARSAGVPPHWLKAIVRQESNFDRWAINPERSFVLGGVRYTASSRTGRAKLREFILGGGAPGGLSPAVNPSIGLAQVRVRIARAFIPGVSAAALFDPRVNLQASARLLRQLMRAGISLDTIDAYNVGQDLSPRNFRYRDRVRAFAKSFEGDFV